jgi:putative ABC transport system permease protein
MLRNYLTVAVRNLLRHKGYSAINIAGLAVGMACCILILLYVQDELGYDRYHKNAGRIFRLVTEVSGGGASTTYALSSAPIAPALRSDYPEVLQVVRFKQNKDGLFVSYGDKLFKEGRIFFTEPSAFEIFTLSLVRGNPVTALKNPYSIVITEKMAQKYFGDEDPMGKIVTIRGQDYLRVKEGDYTITGILENLPHSSHFKFDFLASFATIDNKPVLESWQSLLFYTYLLLPEGYSKVELEEKFPEFTKRHSGEHQGLGEHKFYPHLQPLTHIHLRSRLQAEIEPNNNIAYVYIFSVTACFILFIACINFMNLSTARSARRAKEVGIRKVVGASRFQLIKQFLGESVFLSAMAFLLAIALVEFSLPVFNNLAGKELSLDTISNGLMMAVLFGITLLVGVTSGSYPAFLLSAFQPVETLKGTLKGGSKSSLLRKGLVTVQFVISIILIIGTGVVYNQADYMRRKELGFDRDHVVVVPIQDRSMREGYESVKHELLQNPNVLNATASSYLPGGFKYGLVVRPEGLRETITTHHFFVDHDFLKTLRIELITGRDFSRNSATDPAEAFIANEAAVQKFGWENPIGKQVELLADGNKVTKKGTVIGVVKDFHFESFHEEIGPALIHINQKNFKFISARIRSDNIPATLDFFKQEWQEFDPNHPFEYTFLGEDFDSLSKAESRLGEIVGVFSFLSIFIACLGLFGLASFTAEQRTKEIGIRKALGASVSSIVMLLSKEFLLLVGVANLIAWPVAYYAMNRWLQDFAYRIELEPGVFALGGVLALGIALLTVSAQAIKAARANPVDALRYE